MTIGKDSDKVTIMFETHRFPTIAIQVSANITWI